LIIHTRRGYGTNLGWFDYVSKTYLNGRKTHFEELYDSKIDGFTYEYICDTCGKTFRTNLKRKKDAKKFCSR
jgi:hypothetical protein